MLKKPLIVINFKIYPESSGNRALALAQKLSRVKTNSYEIIVVPSLVTMKEIVDQTNLIVFSQHVDPDSLGASTGKVLMPELKEIGVCGSLINHSERKVPFSILAKALNLAKKNKFILIACASSLSEVKKIAALNPDYIAYEPPELIGGKISVAEAQPQSIVKAVKLVKTVSPSTKVLCGAGVTKKQDLQQALALGTSGVLIGHAIPKARNPYKLLQQMALK